MQIFIIVSLIHVKTKLLCNINRDYLWIFSCFVGQLTKIAPDTAAVFQIGNK